MMLPARQFEKATEESGSSSAPGHAHGAHEAPSAVGGKILTRPYIAILAVAAVGLGLMLWRFIVGLGATTAMNDGYPWGLWIAFDVVTGTAIAAGGYGMALMIYIFNKGQYHPLVRPAILTTALGYSIAGFSIVVDVGRFWNIWKVPLYVGSWNLNSALLEVALCVMAYMMVAWLELSGSAMERWELSQTWPRLARASEWLLPVFRKALPLLIAAGILLPTMHQSSLGSLMLFTNKLHPLWASPWLPLLFLISCLSMGYAGVVVESTLSSYAFKRQPEWSILSPVGRVIAYTLIGWTALRVGDAIYRGAFANVSTLLMVMFVLELALFLIPAGILLSKKLRTNPGVLFASAVMVVFGGALYRFDTYLVAFNPGDNWAYFPSVTETLITVGLVAIELAIYIFAVKKFPILSGRSSAPAPAPAA